MAKVGWQSCKLTTILDNFHKTLEVGVARDTIYDYFQILLDCLIINKINPISSSDTRKRLSKAPKFLFFDLGILRECALKQGYIICRAPRRFVLTPHVTAIPWQELPALLVESN